MDNQCQFPNVHWIWSGAISFVYEVHPRIVVKVPQSGKFERDQFKKELEIYQTFSRNPPCPYIYMRDVSLYYRIQLNQTRDQQTMIITMVHKLEPLALRKEWMNDLTQAVAFLEYLGLAHGNLRPENILLDRNQIKLSDFDCTAKFGALHEACLAPYGRLLSDDEPDLGKRGTAGTLGRRTEQFALGSIYYLTNYGCEVYEDRCLTEDHYGHGPKVVELLQYMEFPKLNGNPLIDEIIDNCWHNKYTTISDLVTDVKALLSGRADSIEGIGSRKKDSSEVATFVGTIFISRWRMLIGRFFQGIWYGLGVRWRSLRQIFKGEVKIAERADGDNRDEVDQDRLGRELERGLLRILCSGEPKDIGFAFGWYRHTIKP
ncbi:hypothetical protein BJX99DRAFT_249495 [Aspergillus californicus]